jgi:predicted O-linked N-acetylglucosamine transferase (SPINDLY family)
MHTGQHRLLTFARKPAPVQLTLLACTSTTGLETMDYRLTDPYLDPPGSPGETIYSETSVVLPATYWCYRPLGPTPAVNSLPASQTGRITFGCLNHFCKVTPALTTWIDLLQAVPDSTLLLLAPRGEHRDAARKLLARRGVSPERLSFADRVPPNEYFQLYHQIDVALDSFPYGGGVTTCDALWMGVPVVSLAGRTAVGRAGLSILSNLGLAELVAGDRDGYVRIASELAQDLARLTELRATLRDQMRASPLMDAPGFARNVEAAYRGMWRRWCSE